MLCRHLLALSALAVSLAAQTIVSPLSCNSAEGDSSNTFPFVTATPRRYMQIHADLGAAPLVITKLTFRVGASTLAFPGTRTHDMELYMGEALPTAVALPNLTFDANYAAPKTLVLPRQFVTFGPTGQSISPGPNPFHPTLEITLATPFAWSGTAPLIWEVAYFGSTTSGGSTSSLDADGSTTVTATSTITGTGCLATGETALMTHAYTVLDARGTLMMNGTITNGPANALALMAIGFVNPAAPVPGWCSNLYTDAVVLQFLGLTSATGSFTADNPTGAFILPNTAVGATLFTQAFAFDPLSSASFPLVMSNGRSATVPAVGTAQVNQVTRLWSNTGPGTTTTAAFGTTIVGYGLATQFTHQ
ncbi:MAG TPA: hypothetical protein VF384_14920 [Planctomycetota bacterium]